MKIVDTTLLDKYKDTPKFHFCIFFTVLILLSLFMLYSYAPVYGGHDLPFHLRRFDSLITALRDGTFPCYIDYKSASGYGYLSNPFYSDVLLLPFAAIALLSDLMSGYYTMIFTYTVLCGVLMYRFVYVVYRNCFAASISAILYTFSLYRLFDLFVRGALGEAISFTFIPLVFLGVYYIIAGDYRKWYVLAIGMSLMIYNHLLSTLLLFIFVLIFIIRFYRHFTNEPKRFYYLLLAGVVTILLTAYFIYPFFEQISSNTFYFNTHNEWDNIQKNTLSLQKIISGLLVSYIEVFDYSYAKIGLLLTLAVFIGFFVKKESSLRATSIYHGVLIGILCILASTAWFPWQFPPFNRLSLIQFPWRLFEFAAFFFSVAGGYYLSRLLPVKKNIYVVMILIVVITCITIATDGKNYYYNWSGAVLNDVQIRVSNEASLGYGLEYLPSRTPSSDFMEERGADSIKSYNETTSVQHVQKTNGLMSFDVSINKLDSLELPLLYYKGYNGYLNNHQLAITQSLNGLIKIPVNESGEVKVYYAGTAIQKISFYVSVVSILVLSLCIILIRKKNRINQNGRSIQY